MSILEFPEYYTTALVAQDNLFLRILRYSSNFRAYVEIICNYDPKFYVKSFDLLH